MTLRRLAADDVLDRAADAARDVQVGRDPQARLADLVGVRPPAGARHDPRAADRAAEQPGQLLEVAEPFGAADASPAADDDLRVGERDPALLGRFAARDATGRGRARTGSPRRSRRPARRPPSGSPAGTAFGATVSSRIGASSQHSSRRLPAQRWRVIRYRLARFDRRRSWRPAAGQPGGDAGEDLVAALRPGADDGRGRARLDDLGDRGRPAVGMVGRQDRVLDDDRRRDPEPGEAGRRGRDA